MIASRGIRSPPVKVYSESHHRQRRLHPVSRTNAHGRPACDDSPWMLWKISVMRINRGIVNARFLESLPAQDARIAVPARPPLSDGVVARTRERLTDAALDAA